MRNSLFLLVVVLGGCAVIKPVALPGGQQGYALSKCGDMAGCFRKAESVCGGRYKVIYQGTETTSTVTNGYGGDRREYTVTVTCPDKK